MALDDGDWVYLMPQEGKKQQGWRSW